MARNREKRKGGAKVRLRGVLAVGLCAVLLAFALVIGDADYRATYLGWLPFLLAVSGIALAFAYIRLLPRFLVIDEQFSSCDCQRGSAVPLAVRFVNKGPLFFFRAEAHLSVADLAGVAALDTTTDLALAPFQTLDTRFNVEFEHVGSYTAGLDYVVLYDFLRLFSRRIDNPRVQNVRVLPNVPYLQNFKFQSEFTTEAASSKRTVLADSLDYAMVREYVPGDPLKTIHWKLSARSENYLTRLFEASMDQNVRIIFDLNVAAEDADYAMALLDGVVEAGIACVQCAQRMGIDFEASWMGAQGEKISVNTWDLNQTVRLVDSMAQRPDAPADSAAQLVREKIGAGMGRSAIIICSPNQNDMLIGALADARIQRCPVTLVAFVPAALDDRARQKRCRPLAQLDAVGGRFAVATAADELVGFEGI